MRVPVDLNGTDLVRAIAKIYGYQKVNQTGSHIKIAKPDGTKPIVIPAHKPLKTGTLRGIIKQLAEYESRRPEDVLAALADWL